MKHRFLASTSLLAAAAVLVACGGNPAVKVSVAESGSPAALWGTKGVELHVRNDSSETFYVGFRGYGSIDALNPGQKRIFSNESTLGDDVELLLRWNADSGDRGVDIDVSNPAIGKPNVYISHWVKGDHVECRWDDGVGTMWSFDVDESKRCFMRNFLIKQGQTPSVTVFDVWRWNDSEDFKRFDINVSAQE